MNINSSLQDSTFLAKTKIIMFEISIRYLKRIQRFNNFLIFTHIMKLHLEIV